MKSTTRIMMIYGILSIIALIQSQGATWYVSPNSLFNGPGTSWDNAFHDIQSGVDAAVDGDIVLVGDGVYDSGGRTTWYSSLRNRVVVEKNILVASVNGPNKTIIVGHGAM